MSTKKVGFPSGRQMAFISGTDKPGNKDMKGSRVMLDVTSGGKKYSIYPWGANNKLPVEKMQLLRTNGDAMNLLGTRADFLFGAGFGFFRHSYDAKGKLVRTPYLEGIYQDNIAKIDLPYVVNQFVVSLTETYNILLRKKLDGGIPVLESVDVATMRLVVSDSKSSPVAILCPDWTDEEAISKRSVPVPLISLTDKSEGHIHIKPPQTGQSYYGFPQWWSDESSDWLSIMNTVSNKIKKASDGNNNISHLARVGEDYIKKMVDEQPVKEGEEVEEYDYDKELAKARDKFYDNVEKYLLTGELKVLVDECGYGADGKMAPNIEFSEVKRSLNAKEYIESYDAALRAFANASGILSGLAGIDTGARMGGSGSELKVAANFQQTFRTARERLLICRCIDAVYREPLQLPGDVFPGFIDNILVNDNADKSGVSQAQTQETTK